MPPLQKQQQKNWFQRLMEGPGSGSSAAIATTPAVAGWTANPNTPAQLVPRSLPANFDQLPWHVKRHYKKMWEEEVRAMEAWEASYRQAQRAKEIEKAKAEKVKQRREAQAAK